MSEGPLPLVLLPPLGHDGRIYDAFAEALAPEIEVLALDYPRFGGRDLEWPRPKGDVFAALAEDVASELAHRHLGELGPYSLGGISLGATLAIHLATTLPSPPSHLLLMATGGRRVAKVRRNAITQAIESSDPTVFAETHLGIASARTGVLEHVAPAAQERDDVKRYVHHHAEMTWGRERASLGPRAELAAEALRSAIQVNLEEAMQRNDVSADIVWGDADRLFGRKHTERVHGLLRRSRLHILPGVGHYPALEAPEAVASIMREALDERGKWPLYPS